MSVRSSAIRRHKFARHLGRPSSSIRSGLGFRYTRASPLIALPMKGSISLKRPDCMTRIPQTRWLWRLRVALIAAMYLTALFILMSTEYGPFAITVALLTWALLNFLWLIVLRRPGVAAALSLALVAMLIGLSQFKYGITQLTLTFLDFLI